MMKVDTNVFICVCRV